jgi:hypothetical protein
MADLALCSGEELRQAVHLSYLVDTGLHQGMVRTVYGQALILKSETRKVVKKEGWIEESPTQKQKLWKKFKKSFSTPKNFRVL